jgi:hypothetical protein
MLLCTLARMTPPDNSERKQDWFDKLPKKVRIVLLMVVTSATSLILFLFGVHAYRTGEHTNYAGHEESAGGDFLYSLGALVVTGLLFAAYLRYFDRNKDDRSK